MKNKPADLEQLRTMLLFSKTLMEPAIHNRMTDGLRFMMHQHTEDITRVTSEPVQQTYLVGTVDLDGEQLLIEVFADGQCHVARRAGSWETWPAGAWSTLEERNCG